MQKANTDTTYCTSITCMEKCWRHRSNFIFEEDENYWFMNTCENAKELK